MRTDSTRSFCPELAIEPEADAPALVPPAVVPPAVEPVVPPPAVEPVVLPPAVEPLVEPPVLELESRRPRISTWWFTCCRSSLALPSSW